MAKILIHLATGPENPSRAALALLVAKTAVSEGHEVQVFLAADAVQLARPETAGAVQGVGTGSFAEHWDALTAAGTPICPLACARPRTNPGRVAISRTATKTR